MSESHEKLDAVFAAAVELSGDERARYLDKACAGNAELRQQVERLLRSLDRAGTFLTQAAGGKERATVQVSDASDASRPVTLTEKPGHMVGRYKLREKIGEGGCGVVYVAEQEEPVRRRVALKVIKLGMDTKSVIARFEAERQALAMMDHPNIAKVFDAGATETGRPYFVMELVRGIRITDYCDQAKLPMAQRLALFTQVCSAVQHAHQKGIIHRDLKPSNILVTLHDGVPMPKVIDFGIAKATEGRLTDKTIYTELHQLIGTPAYMSPEQAGMSALDIDTRSDIYSLGVLLYELLTSRTPFDAKDLLQAGFDEMRRRIREEEPQRPSTRLSTLLGADLTTVANQRQAEAPKLITLLRGDLDWIVMRCLEKDRTRRYETANGLAADIQRHLGNEPVIARPPSVAYRFGKFARRNKLTLTAAAAVFLTLVLGLWLSAWQAVRATRAERAQTSLRREAEQARSIEVTLRQRAEVSEKKATDEATIATAVSDFLRSDLLQTAGSGHQADYLQITANPNLTMVEALDRAAEGVKDRFRARPVVEAAIRYTIGVTYNDLGEHWAAIPQLERALELRRPHLGLAHDHTLRAMSALAHAYLQVDRLTNALPLLEECARLARARFGENHSETRDVLHNLARGYIHTHRAAQAIQLLEEILRRDTETAGTKHRDIAATLGALAAAYSEARQPSKAIEFALQSYRAYRESSSPEHPLMQTAMHNLAVFYLQARRTNDALPLFEESLRLTRKTQAPDSPNLLTTINLLAGVYQGLGRNEEAERLVHESDRIARKASDKSPAQLLRSLQLQADFLAGRGQYGPAEALYAEAAQLSRRTADDPYKTRSGVGALAVFFTSRGRYAEAESLYQEILAKARERETNASPRLEGPLYDLAEVLYRQAKYAKAEPLYREHRQSLLLRHFATNDNVIGTTASLGRLLADWAWSEHTNKSNFQNRRPDIVERAREAEQLLHECLVARLANTNISRGRLGDSKSRLGVAMLSLAVTDLTLGAAGRNAKLGEAESLLLAGEELLRQSKSIESKYKRDALERLVRFYSAVGRMDQAAEWKRKLEAFEPSVTEKEPEPVSEAPNETLTPPERGITPERITL